MVLERGRLGYKSALTLRRYILDRLKSLNQNTYPRLTRYICASTRIGCLSALFLSGLCQNYLDTLSGSSPSASKLQTHAIVQARRSSLVPGPLLDRYPGKSKNSGLSQLSDPKFDFVLHLLGSDRIKRLNSLHLNYQNSLYVLWLALVIAVALLDTEPLEGWRHLDCILLGRFSVNARASIASKYMSLIFFSCFLLERHLIGGDLLQLRLEALDFSLHSSDYVARRINNLELKCCQLRSPRHKDVFEIFYSHRKTGEENGLESSKFIDRVLFASAHFGSSTIYVLKLTRSTSHWFWYNFFISFLFLGHFIFVVSWMVFFLLVITPTIVTKRGYEFLYPNCLYALSSYVGNNLTRANQFSFIYEPRVIHLPLSSSSSSSSSSSFSSNLTSIRLLYGHDSAESAHWPAWLPLEDYISGWYHWLRMFFDYFESMTLYFGIVAFFAGNIMFIMITSGDLILNAVLIQRRLVCLHQNLCVKRQSREERSLSFALPPETPHLRFSGRLSQPASDKCDIMRGMRTRHEQSKTLAISDKQLEVALEHDPHLLQVIQLQALLIDQFNTTTKCKEFVSFYCLFCGLIWILYSIVVLMWRGLKGGRGIEIELYAAILIAASLVTVLLLILSLVRTWNRAFYPLVASIMGLHDCHEQLAPLIKKRWMLVLSHFHPKPRYCFTVISVEISPLLIIKVSRDIQDMVFVLVCVLICARQNISKSNNLS